MFVCIHEGRLRTALTMKRILLSHDTRKPVFVFPTRSDTNRAVWPKEMARGSDSGSRGSLLSVYAVQPCGYATLFLYMQNAGFLMTRLILWKPKINNTQAIKMIIFRGDSH